MLLQSSNMLIIMLLFMVMPALFGGFGNLKLPLNIFIYIIFENYLLNTLKLFSKMNLKLLLFGIKDILFNVFCTDIYLFML